MEHSDLSFFAKNSDYLDYCPFVLGLAKSELGLRKINETQPDGTDRDKHFQIDSESYEHYLLSKRLMRKLHPSEDYHHNLSQEEVISVFKYLSQQLISENPKYFSFHGGKFYINNMLGQSTCCENGSEFTIEADYPYRDCLDLIALNIQEDFCLVNKNDLKAKLIHLASPNDWTAKWGITKNFDEIHVRTPRAFEIVKRPAQIFSRIFDSGFLYERLGAMTLTSYAYLLRHPSHKETAISSNNSHFFFRFERQTLKAIPNTDLLLFTIRPYLMDFTNRVKREINLELVEQMSSGQLENRYSWFFKANRDYFLNLFQA